LAKYSTSFASGVRDLIEARGAELKFLPPYSPDLNPIEQAISKIKAHMRKAAARSYDAICENLGRIIDTFTQAECKNFLANAGMRKIISKPL
jgi:transposase